eukprot:PhF_6_TR14894/c0_g1_i1/m.23226
MAEEICVVFTGHSFTEVPSIISEIANKGGVKPAAYDHVTCTVDGRTMSLVEVTEPAHLKGMKFDVIVMCYTAVQPATLEWVEATWGPYWLDVENKNKGKILCGTRTDLLAKASVLRALQKAGIQAVSVAAAGGFAQRLQCSHLHEVSVLPSPHNITELLKSIIELKDNPSRRLTTFNVASRQNMDAVEMERQTCMNSAGKPVGPKWSAARHSSGKIYYINNETKQRTWNRPPDFDGVEPMKTVAEIEEETLARIAEEKRKQREQRALAFQQKELDALQTHEKNKLELEMMIISLNRDVHVLEKERQQQRDSQTGYTTSRAKAQGVLDQEIATKADYVRKMKSQDSEHDTEMNELKVIYQGLEEERSRLHQSPAYLLTQDNIIEAEAVNRAMSIHLTEALEETVKLRTDLKRIQGLKDEYTNHCEALLSSLSKLLDDCEELHLKAKDVREECQSLSDNHQSLSNILHQHRRKQEQSALTIAELKDEREKLFERCKQLDIRISQQQKLLQVSMEQQRNLGVKSQRKIDTIQDHKKVIAETKDYFQLNMKVTIRSITKVNLSLVSNYHECHRLRCALIDSAEMEHKFRDDLCELLTTERDAALSLTYMLSEDYHTVAQQDRSPQEDSELLYLSKLYHTYMQMYQEIVDTLQRYEGDVTYLAKFEQMKQAIEFADSVVLAVERHTGLSGDLDPEGCVEKLQRLSTVGVSLDTLSSLQDEVEDATVEEAPQTAQKKYEEVVKNLTKKIERSMPKHVDCAMSTFSKPSLRSTGGRMKF